MKHNGNLKVSGKIASTKIVVGDFSGTTVTSGSYQFPYPIGDFRSLLGVSLDISGNKIITFNKLDATIIPYTPLVPADWSPTNPTSINEGLDILSHGLKYHVHPAISLTTTILDNTYVLQPDGLGGVQWNPMSAVGLTNYYTKTQTNAISAYLQSEIDYVSAEVVALSASLGAVEFTGLTDAPSSYVGHAGEVVSVNQTETGLAFVPLLYGTIICNTVSQSYTAYNAKLTANSLPIVSLTIPLSSAEQLVVNACNIRSGAFDVVLSSPPISAGYSINWFSLNNI